MKLAPDNWETWKTREMDCTALLVFAACLSHIIQSSLHFHIITDLPRSVHFFFYIFLVGYQTNNHFCVSASKKEKKNNL